jgi:putative Mg2+ transporter-C (MgtC) family protein
MSAAASSLEIIDIAYRLGAALGLSAMIGLERELTKHAAGLRTMMLVGLGSATFVLAGYEMLAEAGLASGAQAGHLGDMTRVLQGIVGGIGFLGAGAVMQSQRSVKGMTTAASIWVTSALGMACGLGLYRLALMAGVAALFTLVALAVVERRVVDPVKAPEGADLGGSPNEHQA